ncbi:MAG: hypothetical protein RRZ38_13735 [Hafnia sp.]
MNQEKLDCLKKRAAESTKRLDINLNKAKGALSSPLAYIAPPEIKEAINEDIQQNLNTRSLITDLVHALEENGQPIHSTSIIGIDLAADIAEFTFGLNQPVAIIASGEEGRVIARAQYTTAEDCYYLHYRAADGRAVSSWLIR